MPQESQLLKGAGTLFEFNRRIINAILARKEDVDQRIRHALGNEEMIGCIAEILTHNGTAITHREFDTHAIKIIRGNIFSATFSTETCQKHLTIGDAIIYRGEGDVSYGSAGWVVRFSFVDNDPENLPLIHVAFADRRKDNRHDAVVASEDLETVPFTVGQFVKARHDRIQRYGMLFTENVQNLAGVLDIYPFDGIWLMDLKLNEPGLVTSPRLNGYLASDFKPV